MQVKPASTNGKEKPEERRLFVGQLSKNTTDEDLHIMFTPFGSVEDVSIIRDENGTSKSAAFVRMATRVQAHNAIASLHQSQTLPVRGQAHVHSACSVLYTHLYIIHILFELSFFVL